MSNKSKIYSIIPLIKSYLFWILCIRPQPPNLLKELVVKKFGKQYKIKTFIETGTFRGEMIEAVKTSFDKIFSIELDPTLYKNAKRKFSGETNIEIFEGDSSKILPDILKKINETSLFWLDAHFSGIMCGIKTTRGEKETPILEELITIANHRIKNHVILIDGAVDFTGENDYPSVKELEKFIFSHFPDHEMEIKRNIIRIYPKLGSS